MTWRGARQYLPRVLARAGVHWAKAPGFFLMGCPFFRVNPSR